MAGNDLSRAVLDHDFEKTNLNMGILSNPCHDENRELLSLVVLFLT